MKRVVKFSIYILVFFLVFYNLVITIKKVANPNKIPSFFGFKNFIVVSGSMEDTLSIGDIIFVRENDNIEENDIVAFVDGQATVTHRVIGTTEIDGKKFYETKGDANNSADDNLIPHEQVEGKYCFKIAKIGSLIITLQTPKGMAVMLLIFLATIILTNMYGGKTKKIKGKHMKK